MNIKINLIALYIMFLIKKDCCLAYKKIEC